MNHGKQLSQVLQEYPVSAMLCKLLHRLVAEFGMTGSAEEKMGGWGIERKKSCFY